MTAVPAVFRSLDDWAALVRSDLTGAVEGLIAAGRHLLEAKGDHPGTFVAWLGSSPFGLSQRQSYRLMEVAGTLQASIDMGCLPTLASLPADRSALYELARLEPEALGRAVEVGDITPATGQKEAKALVARYRTATKPRLTVVPPADGGSEQPTTFATVVIDPPWQYDNKATRGAASDHYPTMTLMELETLHVPAAPDSHLYLWVTNGFLREGFQLLDTWDFIYRTCLTWVKPQMGLGNYFRSSTEHVLFATKGTLPIAPADRRMNWFQADRRAHSAKPESFYDIVERVSPGPHLEMFARRRRLGWHVWGNEA